MNLAVLLRGARGIDYFEFVASKDGVDVNFFTWGNVPTQGMGWRVDINGQATTQQANKLSFKKGDTVRLNYGMGGVYECWFRAQGRDYILEARGALPRGAGDVLWVAFDECRSLRKIENTLFKHHNGNALSTFWGCESLEEVPKGLFYGFNGQRFFQTFYGCRSLRSVDVNEFANLTNLYDVAGMFSGCTSLRGEIRFRATGIRDVQNFAYGVPDGALTVYVPRGSKTAESFKTLTNIRLVEE